MAEPARHIPIAAPDARAVVAATEVANALDLIRYLLTVIDSGHKMSRTDLVELKETIGRIKYPQPE